MRTPLRLVVPGGVAERLRVLLIEDDPGDALLVARLLERSDFALIHVSTMASALHSIGSQPPDIVLFDLLLPDAHGAGALTRLRAALPAAPILALTGAYEPGSALQMIEQIEECREMTAEATVAVDRIRVAVNRRIRGALATVPKADRPKKESASQPPRRDGRRLPVPITLEDRPENAGLVSDRGDRDDEI